MSSKSSKEKRRMLSSEVAKHFSFPDLKRVCEAKENTFGDMYDWLVEYQIPNKGEYNFFYYGQADSKILAVAHLDTVANVKKRECNIVKTQAGPVVFSRALDDRLGAYIILELLPALGIQFDILLTTGEEVGQSTAGYFTNKIVKEAYNDPDYHYNWVIEFDRGGTDVVMYSYEDKDTIGYVESCGAKVGFGSFSDISYLDLEIKAFNWGCGYQDYHYANAHAYLLDTFGMVEKFLIFHEFYKDMHMPHEEIDWKSYVTSYNYKPGGSRYGGYSHGGGIYSEGYNADDESEYYNWLSSHGGTSNNKPTENSGMSEYPSIDAYFAEKEREEREELPDITDPFFVDANGDTIRASDIISCERVTEDIELPD